MIDFIKEIKDLENKLLINPNDFSVMNSLAIAHLEMDELEKAHNYFKKVVDINPSVQSYNNLGFFYYSVGEPVDSYESKPADNLAKEILEKTLTLNSNVHYPYTILGECYLNLGQIDDASVVLKKAVDIESTVETLNNLGVCYFLKDDFQNAKELFYKASISGNLTPLLNYGYCLAKLSENSKAKEVAEEIIKRHKEDFKIAEHEVADIYYELGDYKKVVEIYKASQYMYSYDWVSRYLYSLQVTGQFELQDDCFEKVIKSVEKEINMIIDDDDDYWIPHERLEYIYELRAEIAKYQEILAKIQDGHRPELNFVPSTVINCYLFGCKRHNVSNYNG
ncbi:MAG: domain containing-containing protein [Bacillales bacterium]|jgi:tetratricopeptide (TPR) repeat protein|nr:domain containing-containing protein [Bacillales bacterium]